MKLKTIIDHGVKVETSYIGYVAFTYEHNSNYYTYDYYFKGNAANHLYILLEWCEDGIWYDIRRVIKVPPALAMYFNLLVMAKS